MLTWILYIFVVIKKKILEVCQMTGTITGSFFFLLITYQTLNKESIMNKVIFFVKSSKNI